MYIFGGYDGFYRLNDLWEFNLATSTIPSFGIPCSTIINDLKEYVNNPFLSDINFLLNDKQDKIYAHKILLIRVEYFKAMFSNDMRESNQSEIIIQDIDKQTFLWLLEFIYTDEIDDKIPIDYDNLFLAADRFGVNRLKKLCENCILANISIENAATILGLADAHHCIELKKKSLEYILDNFDEVSKTDSFDDLGRKNWNVVKELLLER